MTFFAIGQHAALELLGAGMSSSELLMTPTAVPHRQKYTQRVLKSKSHKLMTQYGRALIQVAFQAGGLATAPIYCEA